MLPATVLLCLPLANCASPQLRAAQTAAAETLVSDEQLEQLGEQLHTELEKQGIKYVTDPVVTGYVDGIAEPIFAKAREQRPKVHWHVHVVDNREEVNAFATAGGHIYITTGLLLTAEDTSEVAGVLAHEAGHILAQHPARQLVAQYGITALAQVALGQDPGMLQQIAAQIAGTGALLAHSRAAENEADEFAARLAADAGYDPAGIVRFFKGLQEAQGRTPEALSWLMTHPTPQSRIQRVEQFIAQNNLKGGGAGQAGQLERVQQRLGGSQAMR